MLLNPVFEFLGNYGWHVTFAVLAIYITYAKFLKDPLNQYLAAKQQEASAQRSEEARRKTHEALQKAREKQQRLHDEAAEREKVLAEEKRREKIEAAKKQQAEEALGDKEGFAAHKGGKVEKKPKETTAELIDRLVASKPVVVFSKSWCPYCRKAKSALSTYRLPEEFYEYIELDEEEHLDGEGIQDEFMTRFGSRSVPKVFIGGKMIGGGDDTVTLHREGELDRLVAEAVQIFMEKL